MNKSKLVHSVFVFLCFASSTVSCYSNTRLTAHKYKCSPQQSRALLLFKQSLSSINNSIDDPPYYSPCQDWLGSAGYYPIMMNWNTSTDCCDWEGVTCDRSTGDVIGLDLSCGMLQGTILPNTSFFNLPRLQKLNLAFNDFYHSQIPSEIGRFSKTLTRLNVSGCGFSGKVPTNITLLHNLVSLDLSQNGNVLSLEPHVFVNMLQNSTSLKQLSLESVNISSILPDHINISSSSSSSLTLLNLKSTRLQGKLPPFIFNFQALEELDLSFNNFTGQIPSEISLLPKLVSLDLTWNYYLRIEPNIFNSLLNNSTLRDLSLGDVNISWVLPTDSINISSSLTYLDLFNCNLMGSLPKSPLNVTHLTHLELSSNKLNGTLPSWLFTLPSLEYLDLSYNMFSGDVPFNSSALPPLKRLYLGGNQLGGQIDEALILKFTNLTELDLSYNNFSSEWELDTLSSSLTNLEQLILSYSGLSLTTSNVTHNANPNMWFLHLASCKIKEFPLSLRSMRNLEELDLSNNEIQGDIPIWAGEIGGDNQLNTLDLSHNSITGLPQFQLYGLGFLYLQSNQIQGPFPPSICNMNQLQFLNMSDNRIDGVIPQCLGNITSLVLTDLGGNDFHGKIPNLYENCGSLEWLILNGNWLQGEVPSSLSKCKSLKVIDLGNNHLNGTFPHWLGDLPDLQVLVLKSNKLNGPILNSSTVKKPFTSLRVIDLSHNGFIGRLPQKYFQNFYSMKNIVRNSMEPKYLETSNGLYYSITFAMKGVERNFPQLLVDYTIVDVSNNSFDGEIPAIIGDLNSLKVLNLSHNSLTGCIPHALGNLSEIESLDLSWNQLGGEIPQSLADINELAVLNLSQNNLIGRIPKGQQFNTFTEYSFGGNSGLCGLPLPKNCEHTRVKGGVDEEENDEEESGSTWIAVVMGYGCGTLLGMIIGYLMLSTGKPEWFNAISEAVEHTILKKRNKRRYIYIGR